MRVDTTVVEAPIHYPVVAAGVKLPFALRRVGRAVSRRARAIGEALRLRGDAAREAIKKPYRGLLRITGRLLRQAEQAVASLGRGLGKQVIRQARARVFRGEGAGG